MKIYEARRLPLREDSCNTPRAATIIAVTIATIIAATIATQPEAGR